MKRRIVVVRAGALGDTLLTLPALEILRGRFPDHRIDVVGYPDLWAVAAPLVDGIFPVDSPPWSTLWTPSPSRDLDARLDDVDLLVVWSSRDAGEMNFAGQKIHSSPYPPPGVHAAAWLARSVGYEPGSIARAPAPALTLWPEERATAARIFREMGLERPVVIHPGSGARWKQWPPKKFARLANALRARGRSVVLIEGPADAEAVADVQAHTDEFLPVVRRPALRDLAAVLAESETVVGNDSGITHLAAAAGARTVALFGPTDPASWAPLGNTRVIRACATRAVRQGQIRVCQDPACMAAIEVEDVLDAAGYVES